MNENHVIYTMEPRYESGVFVSQRHLKPHAYLHPTRDLAVTHLDDEEKTIHMFQKHLGHTYETRLNFCEENQIAASSGQNVRALYDKTH